MQLPKTGDRILGKYVLENALGEGGMGVVFAARHDLLGQRVAVKLIRPEFATREDTVARFLNEARAAALIQNEHVARVLDVGTLDSGLPYMVLEYLPGNDLARVLVDRGPLPVADVADYLLEAIDAVAHAHSLGIVHRDLKPSNLFLTKRQDGTVLVKVFDFGISKIMTPEGGTSASMTHTNALLGSPLYMSPEQLRDSKNVDHRCDIWALGVVAYELLTGRTPFTADNAVALFAAIQEQEPATVSSLRQGVSPALDAIVMRCLRRRGDERWSSVTELAFALAPFGTHIAQRALENAARILPLKDIAQTGPNGRDSVGPFPANAGNALSGSSPPAGPSGRAITAVGVSTSIPGVPSTTRTGIVLGLASLGLFMMIVTGGFFVTRSRTSQVDADASAATPGSVSTVAPSASAPPLAFVPLEPGSAAPIASAEPSSSLGLPAVQTPPPQPLALTPRPLAPTIPVTGRPAPPPPSAAPAASGPRPECVPPYKFDASGKKIWKRECV